MRRPLLIFAFAAACAILLLNAAPSTSWVYGGAAVSAGVTGMIRFTFGVIVAIMAVGWWMFQERSQP